MKQRLLFFACVLGMMTTLVAQTTDEIANPQVSMVGSRALSLGITNPAVKGDTNFLFINPAVLGGTEPMPLAVSQRNILGSFDVLMLHATRAGYIPYRRNGKDYRQRVNFGLSYGSNMLRGIPETIFENTNNEERVRQTGSFDGGFDVISLSGGVGFLDTLNFDELSVGAAVKRIGQKVGGNSRSAFTIDAGAIGTRYLDLDYLDKAHVGLSVLNALPTELTWSGGQGSARLPLEVYLGGKLDLFGERLSLLANTGVENLSIGAEYSLQRAIQLRGSSDLNQISLGVGLLFDGVAGVYGNAYSLRLDFDYTQNEFPFSNDPNFAFSLSIIGASRPSTPYIIVPNDDVTVKSDKVTLQGTGPKDTTIRIFNNNNLARTTITDKFGKWTYRDFPLKEGENSLSVKAYSLLRDDSVASEKVIVTSDTSPPKLKVDAFPVGRKLVVQVSAPEAIAAVDGRVEDKALLFSLTDAGIWEAKLDLPEALRNYSPPQSAFLTMSIVAKDTIGNPTEEVVTPFFVDLEFPEDRTVHYSDRIRFLGQSSDLVSMVTIDGVEAVTDAENNFSLATPLKPGKNLVNLDVVAGNGKAITHTLRILRLVTFPDLLSQGGFNQIRERREIEFLATLGVLHGDDDGNFYPDRAVTRRYLTEILVKTSELALPEITEDVFSDVSQDDTEAAIIKAAIDNGLAYAYPDGTFRPDQELTLAETIFMLSSAGFINESEVPVGEDSGFLTRKALAKYLAYTPKYEVKIERLIDWNRGYYQ